MSTAAVDKRHALGLPAGSVRATHILVIVGLICGILLVPGVRDYRVPPYLYLLFLVGIGHYFAAHGNDIAPRGLVGRSPLYLPAGTVRFLVIGALTGAFGWLAYSDPDKLSRSFQGSLEEMKSQPEVALAILGAFFLGSVVRVIVGRDNPPKFWQDFEAWLSLVSLLALFGAVLVHLVVGTSVTQRLALPVGEGIVGAGVAFYFGARS